MNKVTIALLLLATMPLYGTRAKKAHKTPSIGHYLHEMKKCRKEQKSAQQQTRQAETERKDFVDSQLKKQCNSDLKELCIKFIVGGCMYGYLEYGPKISNYFKLNKIILIVGESSV